jgi:hypothetical protein
VLFTVFLQGLHQAKRPYIQPPRYRRHSEAATVSHETEGLPLKAVKRGIVENAFEKRGGTLMRIKAENATMSCYSCGGLDEWNPAAVLTHTCSKCGLTSDQDYKCGKECVEAGPRGLIVKKQAIDSVVRLYA